MPGGNIKELRRRIKSVKSTQQITRAMKLVAASKLRRAQGQMENARPYAAGIKELLVSLVRRVGFEAHPLLQRRDGNKTLLVVVTADRGLAGSFNANVLRAADKYIERHAGSRDITLQLVGRKGRDYYKRRGTPVRGAEADLFRNLDFDQSRRVAGDLIDAFVEEDYDEIVVLSNRFKSLIAQDVTFETLLPAGGGDVAEQAGADDAGGDYIFEPGPEELLAAIIPRAVETLVHQVLLESYASEMGARMVAMENATKNAGEMIDHLTLVMNRARQASITTEIIEIVSGAQALESSSR